MKDFGIDVQTVLFSMKMYVGCLTLALYAEYRLCYLNTDMSKKVTTSCRQIFCTISWVPLSCFIMFLFLHVLIVTIGHTKPISKSKRCESFSAAVDF